MTQILNYYIETYPYWITNHAEAQPPGDYLFKLLTPEKFEKLRIPSKAEIN